MVPYGTVDEAAKAQPGVPPVIADSGTGLAPAKPKNSITDGQ
jgi:hypothetical protein